MKNRWRSMVALLVCVVLLLSGCGSGGPVPSEPESEFDVKCQDLFEFASNSGKFDMDSGVKLFLSGSSGAYRALTVFGSGDDFRSAFDSAVKSFCEMLPHHDDMKYLKLDVVNNINPITPEELKSNLLGYESCNYRCGLAFDEDFDIAFLESELNSCGLYDYETGELDFDFLNLYQDACGRDGFSSIPDSYYAFDTFGYFSDADGSLHALNSDMYDWSYGRRVDYELQDILLKSGEFMADQVQDSGRFVYGYGYYDNQVIEGYNILRHAGAMWALMNYYDLVPSEDLEQKVKSCMGFLLGQIRYIDDMAFVYDSESDEFKVGAAGLGLVALVNYIERFGNDLPEVDLYEICEGLADGILYCLESDWTFNHVYDLDLNLIAKTRTVYYDGEATYGLMRLYNLTGDDRYFNTVREIILNNFIPNGYASIGDHWVAYTLNSFLHEEYDSDIFEFALQNIVENLDFWGSIQTAHAARFEACANLLDILNLVQENAWEIPVWFVGQEARFRSAVDYVLERNIDGFMFPEFAMHMSQPDLVLNGFYDRSDYFRTRIDDAQHSFNGILLYFGHRG